MGQAVPKHLPSSTLACPPSEQYIRQYWGNMIQRNGSAIDLQKKDLLLSGKENKSKKQPLETERVVNKHQ